MIPAHREVALAGLQPHPRNYNRHSAQQLEHLKASLTRFGQVRSIVVWRNLILAGHGLTEATDAPAWATLRADVLPDDYAEELALAYLVADNELARLSDPDTDALLAILEDVRQTETALLDAVGFESEAVAAFLDKMQADAALPAPERPPRAPDGYVPDALWPSDNEWGIPTLDLNMQATALDQPALIWGSVARSTRHRGTWLFYTSDDRYEALWKEPSAPLRTQCLTCTEPNFSAYTNMPLPVALWAIYRKRWIARYWQSQGVRIFADLNVGANWAELNRAGIPQGWKAFSTRGYVERLDSTHDEYRMACEIAGAGVTPLFVVYGGNVEVKQECKRMGWLWIPERMDVANARGVADG